VARLAALPVGLAVLLSVSGWLYLLGRKGMPGPPVGDALPLDELARHSAVPLVVFVAAWSAASVILACVARLFPLGRLAAALLLGLLVGSWTYLTTAVSILTVRQIAAESAFRDAATLRAVLVPSLLAALAGATLSRGELLPGKSLRTVLAWFTAASGLIGVIDSVLPQHSTTLVADFAPGARPLASALIAPFGLALVYVARGLGRGSRRAWQLALVLLLGSTVLHLAHSDYGALATGGLAACLVARRDDFRMVGDPSRRRHVASRLALVVTAILLYGIAALWANRLATDRSFTVAFALR